MRTRAIKFKDIPEKQCPGPKRGEGTNWSLVIGNFLGQGLEAIELLDVDIVYGSAHSAIRILAQRHNLPVKIISRGDRLFLVRTDRGFDLG